MKSPNIMGWVTKYEGSKLMLKYLPDRKRDKVKKKNILHLVKCKISEKRVEWHLVQQDSQICVWSLWSNSYWPFHRRWCWSKSYLGCWWVGHGTPADIHGRKDGRSGSCLSLDSAHTAICLNINTKNYISKGEWLHSQGWLSYCHPSNWVGRQYVGLYSKSHWKSK